ncbi:hypothetical protein GEMRC1_008042 [Eukaryota sp. GEM-RC1]
MSSSNASSSVTRQCCVTSYSCSSSIQLQNSLLSHVLSCLKSVDCVANVSLRFNSLILGNNHSLFFKFDSSETSQIYKGRLSCDTQDNNISTLELVKSSVDQLDRLRYLQVLSTDESDIAESQWNLPLLYYLSLKNTTVSQHHLSFSNSLCHLIVENCNITGLNLTNCSSLCSLTLNSASLADVSGFDSLHALKHLTLGKSDFTKSLIQDGFPPLMLSSLYLDCLSLDDLNWIPSMSTLQVLSLNFCICHIFNLQRLEGLRSLQIYGSIRSIAGVFPSIIELKLEKFATDGPKQDMIVAFPSLQVCECDFQAFSDLYSELRAYNNLIIYPLSTHPFDLPLRQFAALLNGVRLGVNRALVEFIQLLSTVHRETLLLDWINALSILHPHLQFENVSVNDTDELSSYGYNPHVNQSTRSVLLQSL